MVSEKLLTVTLRTLRPLRLCASHSQRSEFYFASFAFFAANIPNPNLTIEISIKIVQPRSDNSNASVA